MIRALRILLPLFALSLPWMCLGAAPLEDYPLSSTVRDWRKHPAIDYEQQPTTDPIAQLKTEGPSGYLRSLLDALDVPISSQIAVFAKNSVQASRITPQNPRTIFFNDSVAVGWVRGGFIEVAAQDPRQAVVFYTVESSSSGKLSITRKDDCLAQTVWRSPKSCATRKKTFPLTFKPPL